MQCLPGPGWQPSPLSVPSPRVPSGLWAPHGPALSLTPGLLEYCSALTPKPTLMLCLFPAVCMASPCLCFLICITG